MASPHAQEQSWRRSSTLPDASSSGSSAASSAPYKWSPTSIDAKTGKPYPNSRLVAEFDWEYMFGAKPTATKPSEIVQPAPALPKPLHRAREVAEAFVKRTTGRRIKFRQCIVNRYVGSQVIHRHKDNHLFGEGIVCLTVGSGGEIEFDRPEYASYVHYTERRSAYSMFDEARKDWYHSRKERARNNQQRTCYSVTFRTIRLNDDRAFYAVDDVCEAETAKEASCSGPASGVARSVTDSAWTQAKFDDVVRSQGQRQALVAVSEDNRRWIMREGRPPLAFSMHLTSASLLDAPILVPSQGVEPKVYLWPTTTDLAARRCHKDANHSGRVDLLHFANCRGVGGGYRVGDSTREERGMYAVPELYASLARTTYPFDYRRELKYTLGAELVRDATKGYEFLPPAERFRVNVITAAAAPDLRFPQAMGGDRWDDKEMSALVHAIVRTPPGRSLGIRAAASFHDPARCIRKRRVPQRPGSRRGAVRRGHEGQRQVLPQHRLRDSGRH
jgi:alkylated DNA repair dioxygenase AlkB